jgi:hypothetical protein
VKAAGLDGSISLNELAPHLLAGNLPPQKLALKESQQLFMIDSLWETARPKKRT